MLSKTYSKPPGSAPICEVVPKSTFKLDLNLLTKTAKMRIIIPFVEILKVALIKEQRIFLRQLPLDGFSRIKFFLGEQIEILKIAIPHILLIFFWWEEIH